MAPWALRRGPAGAPLGSAAGRRRCYRGCPSSGAELEGFGCRARNSAPEPPDGRPPECPGYAPRPIADDAASVGWPLYAQDRAQVAGCHAHQREPGLVDRLSRPLCNPTRLWPRRSLVMWWPIAAIPERSGPDAGRPHLPVDSDTYRRHNAVERLRLDLGLPLHCHLPRHTRHHSRRLAQAVLPAPMNANRWAVRQDLLVELWAASCS